MAIIWIDCLQFVNVPVSRWSARVRRTWADRHDGHLDEERPQAGRSSGWNPRVSHIRETIKGGVTLPSRGGVAPPAPRGGSRWPGVPGHNRSRESQINLRSQRADLLSKGATRSALAIRQSR